MPQESERISLYQELDNLPSEEALREYGLRLRDRFGELPHVVRELMTVVPVRLTAKRLGVERITLKGGQIYLYFVGDENKAYYMSPAFGKVLSYLQGNARRTRIREANGKRSIVVADVPDVTTALGILRAINASEPV